jgi:hypothetical protein
VSNLLGGINGFYQTSTDAAAVSLRAAGLTGFYADLVPETLARPFIVLSEGPTKEVEKTKATSNWPRIHRVSVKFMVFANDRATADNILELCEDTFLETPTMLSSDVGLVDRVHLATNFSNRMLEPDAETTGNGWGGMLELIYDLRKN